MLLVRADHDLDIGERLRQCSGIFFPERAESFYAVGEMESIEAEPGERAYAVKQLVRPREGGAAGTVDDAHEVQRLVGGILRKSTSAPAKICKADSGRTSQVLRRVRTG
jgi:hypothetical protein